MERHGYRFDQFIVGRHHDKDDKNPHFHFLANVVLDDGTRANLANIGKAAKEASISVTDGTMGTDTIQSSEEDANGRQEGHQ